MAVLLSNAFTDPNDPWYYVIGVVFLLLIFGALAVYIVFSGKNKKKADSQSSEQNENDDKNNIDTADNTQNADTASDANGLTDTSEIDTDSDKKTTE